MDGWMDRHIKTGCRNVKIKPYFVKQQTIVCFSLDECRIHSRSSSLCLGMKTVKTLNLLSGAVSVVFPVALQAVAIETSETSTHT